MIGAESAGRGELRVVCLGRGELPSQQVQLTRGGAGVVSMDSSMVLGSMPAIMR